MEENEKLSLNIRQLTESEAKEQLYQVTLELWRYQGIVEEILNYILQHRFISKTDNDLFNIIKEWETK